MFSSGNQRWRRRPAPAPSKAQRGNAVIEFALGFTVLWFLFAGVYQYGYSFYVYNLLMTSVTNAAELGSKINYDTGNTSTFTTAIQNMVLYGDESQGNSPVVPGLTVNQVNVTVTTDANSMPAYVTVSIGSVDTPYTINALFGNISLRGKPRATMKYMGQAICSTC